MPHWGRCQGPCVHRTLEAQGMPGPWPGGWYPEQLTRLGSESSVERKGHSFLAEAVARAKARGHNMIEHHAEFPLWLSGLRT